MPRKPPMICNEKPQIQQIHIRISGNIILLLLVNVNAFDVNVYQPWNAFSTEFKLISKWIIGMTTRTIDSIELKFNSEIQLSNIFNKMTPLKPIIIIW